jgi:uncharacterized membrane protein
MVDRAGVSTGVVSHKWKSIALFAVGVCFLIAFMPVLQKYGFWRTRRQFGSLTVDARLNSLLGYAYLGFSICYLGLLAYSHFDPKRRVYKMFDRIVVSVFKSFGALGK